MYLFQNVNSDFLFSFKAPAFTTVRIALAMRLFCQSPCPYLQGNLDLINLQAALMDNVHRDGVGVLHKSLVIFSTNSFIARLPYFFASANFAMMPFLRRRLRTVSVGCAPLPSQERIASSSSLTGASALAGSYQPTVATGVPLRASLESITTTR